MKQRLIILTLLTLATAIQAHAYIPTTRTILNRLAKNYGRGVYQVDEEVQFHNEGDPIVVKERWIVENGDSMRVSVSAPKGSTEDWKLEVLYKNGKRHINDASGVKTVALSTEFIEPYLHYRSGRSILESLIRQRVLPTGLGSMQKQVKTEAGVVYKQEAFVRLARSGGVITYAFGEPSTPNSPHLNPGFWVDQDTFLFRRLRFPSQAEVEGTRHLYAAGGLRIPRDRTVTWGNHSATIRVLQVKRISDDAQTKTLLSTSSIATAKSSPRLPDVEMVREFYQRFR